MLPSDNGEYQKFPPTPPRGLRRMEGMAQLTQLTPSKCMKNLQETLPESIGRPRTLSRTKTVIGPIFPNNSNISPEKTNQNPSKITPPTGMRRSASGSMLLRQTPERMRRQEQDQETSPTKRIRRSGSLPKLDAQNVELESTPKLKRQRTSSLTMLQPSATMLLPPVLTPQRLRPRALSEVRSEVRSETRSEAPELTPNKKRPRQDSTGSRPNSPLKKRHFSTAAIRIAGGQDDEKINTVQTPLRRMKSSVNTRMLLSERISSTYASVARLPPAPPPALVTRTTSGESYYSASEEPPIQSEIVQNEVFVTPQTSFQIEGEMVPLVKKQISIDEKSSATQLEDDEDEGFGDSTKTIKKGQGAALARSLSLKLSPRNDLQKPIGLDTEKSCSTPSLPTAPLLRRSSTSSLRFKVSPSTFLRPPASPTPVEPSVPSTSSMNPETVVTSTTVAEKVEEKSKKSALRKEKTTFAVRDECHLGVAGPRRHRRVKYEGLKVYYFDRRQGESTVPSEGEVSLDMHNTHHTHRYFPLNTGKRPVLDLQLYDDEELSDGEVIHSDEERDYEEFASAKFIASINQKFRIKLLKRSGVKVEKTQSIDELRKMRVECGCSCENGVCIPETCQCAIDGIQCQVDGGEYPTVPCACFAETCTNPNGRIFYDPDAVRHHRTQTIMNWKAAQKSSIGGSPMRKTFVDSDDEDEEAKKTWLLKKAIPIKLESSPTKYPVTPVYTRRSRSNLSDIRESCSEMSTGITPSTSLSDRMKAMQHLENEVCHEVDEKDETIRGEEEEVSDLTLHEVYASEPASSESIEQEQLLEAPTLSPVTLVV